MKTILIFAKDQASALRYVEEETIMNQFLEASEFKNFVYVTKPEHVEGYATTQFTVVFLPGCGLNPLYTPELRSSLFRSIPF